MISARAVLIWTALAALVLGGSWASRHSEPLHPPPADEVSTSGKNEPESAEKKQSGTQPNAIQQHNDRGSQKPNEYGTEGDQPKITDWVQAGSAIVTVGITWGLLVVAKRQTRILDQTLVQTNKAAICVDRIIHSRIWANEGVEGWSFYVQIKNTGNTPTDELVVTSVRLIRDKGIDDKQEFSQGGMIGARTDYLAPIHSVDMKAMRRVHAKEAEVFIGGLCRYRTVFSKKWEITEFCYGVVPIDNPGHPNCRFRFPAVEGRNRAYQANDSKDAHSPLPT